MRFHQVRARAALGGGLAALAGLGCVACVGEPPPPPTPTSTARPFAEIQPIFTTDAEALAAAEAAFSDHLAVADAIVGAGGDDPERIRAVSGNDLSDEIIAVANSLALHGQIITGVSSYSDFRLLERGGFPNERARVTALACLDISHRRVIDSAGTDVTPPRPSERVTMELDFRGVEIGSAELILERSQTWSDDPGC